MAITNLKFCNPSFKIYIGNIKCIYRLIKYNKMRNMVQECCKKLLREDKKLLNFINIVELFKDKTSLAYKMKLIQSDFKISKATGIVVALLSKEINAR